MAGRLSSVALGVCSKLFELLFQLLQFFVGEIFQIDQFISRLLQRTNDFVELEMHRFGVAVLGVLDQEHHQKSDDSGGGIDDELPRIGKMKSGAGEQPNGNHQHGSGKGPRAAEHESGAAGKEAKGVVHYAKQVSLLFVLFQVFRLGMIHKRPFIFASSRESARMEDVHHGESVLWRMDLGIPSDIAWD